MYVTTETPDPYGHVATRIRLSVNTIKKISDRDSASAALCKLMEQGLNAKTLDDLGLILILIFVIIGLFIGFALGIRILLSLPLLPLLSLLECLLELWLRKHLHTSVILVVVPLFSGMVLHAFQPPAPLVAAQATDAVVNSGHVPSSVNVTG